eukprot:4048062-Alexandrium_andersonii.AAC.1
MCIRDRPASTTMPRLHESLGQQYDGKSQRTATCNSRSKDQLLPEHPGGRVLPRGPDTRATSEAWGARTVRRAT